MKIIFRYLIIVALAAISAVVTPAQAKPDLIVSNATLTKDRQDFISGLSFTVTNFCTGAAANNVFVKATFRTSNGKDAKVIATISSNIPTLAGGASMVVDLDVAKSYNGKIGGGRNVLIEVDPNNTVTEAEENNNWRTVNPNDAGKKLSGQFQCSPKQ